jgi:RNA polymerase sigma-70 factor (ECF subfamily)
MNMQTQYGFAQAWPVFFAKPAVNALFLAKPVNQPTDNDREDRDEDLLRQIAAGDRAAFAEFYSRHSTLMFSVASKILNGSPEAEDVLQETFLQIWEKAAKFNPKLGKASTWASIMVRNKAIDRIRASQRRSKLSQDAGAEFSITADLNDTVNDSIYGHEKARLIQTAFVELPPEQRKAIEMAFFAGLTQNEIAEKLKEPIGTIKARIRRGLLKLRDQLEGLV